ncbi:hypothetical protein, partial [Staphylococcus hominis]|uniref:hypothetical protein n=1 Tax=Staphylococcus hominis TaxID=1290 RepID=UPI0011AA61F9
LLPFITSHPYNYHHPVIITQPLLKHHLYTSIHIQQYQSQPPHTKLPPQQITPHIPNLSQNPLKNLHHPPIIYLPPQLKHPHIL